MSHIFLQSENKQYFFDMHNRGDGSQRKRGNRRGFGADGGQDKRPRIMNIDQGLLTQSQKKKKMLTFFFILNFRKMLVLPFFS